MSFAVTQVLLLAALVTALLGLWQWHEGWSESVKLVARGRMDRGEPPRRSWRRWADARVRRTAWGGRLERRLAGAGIARRTVDALLVLALAVVLSALLLRALAGPAGAVAGVAVSALGCEAYLRHHLRRRTEAFVNQLPELARAVSSAAAAGLALPSAIALAAEELGEPARDVLLRVVEELRLGQTVERALRGLEDRVGSRELSVLISTLVVQQRAGGDLVAALRNMAGALEARKDLRREIRTAMAGAVSTSYIVAGLGVGSLLLLNLVSPGVIEQMTHTWVGRVALILSSALYVTGWLIGRRITRIET